MPAAHTILPYVKSFLVMTMLVITSDAGAVPVIDRNSGLLNPGTVIDFDNLMFDDGTPISNQFLSSNVLFGSNYLYDSTNGNSPSISGGFLKAANGSESPGPIHFSEVVSAAIFSFRTVPATTTFTALLNGQIVETFSSATTGLSGITSKFYGFENILFDEIGIEIVADSGIGFTLDNLQFSSVSTVPIPAALPLFGTGLAFIGFMGWRRKRKIN